MCAEVVVTVVVWQSRKKHDAISEGGIVETYRIFCLRLDEIWEDKWLLYFIHE